MDNTQADKFLNDPKNYKKGLIYSCKEDPRLVVPKRCKWMGWTLNFAHPQSILVLLLFTLIVTVPTLFAIFIYPKSVAGILLTEAVSIVIIIMLSIKFSK